jgi:hypothetical protein
MFSSDTVYYEIRRLDSQDQTGCLGFTLELRIIRIVLRHVALSELGQGLWLGIRDRKYKIMWLRPRAPGGGSRR